MVTVQVPLERPQEGEVLRQREKQAPHGVPDVGGDPRTLDHDLSQRQTLNRRATQASQQDQF